MSTKKTTRNFWNLEKENIGEGVAFLGLAKETQREVTYFHYKENPNLTSKRHMNELLSILRVEGGGLGWRGRGFTDVIP